MDRAGKLVGLAICESSNFLWEKSNSEASFTWIPTGLKFNVISGYDRWRWSCLVKVRCYRHSLNLHNI
jgi:hypothetical protein